MNTASLFTYAEARKIANSTDGLAVRRVGNPIDRTDPPADARMYGIWDTNADQWLIPELAREILDAQPREPSP